LQALVRKGKSSPRRITRGRILLLAAEDRSDGEMAAVLHSSRWLTLGIGRSAKALDFCRSRI